MGINQFDHDPDPHFQFLCEHGACRKTLSQFQHNLIKIYEYKFMYKEKADLYENLFAPQETGFSKITSPSCSSVHWFVCLSV